MTHSPLTNGIQLTSDCSSRNGARVDRFIIHHAATTSLAAILSLFQPGGRTVSANYALGSDGSLILAVDEIMRAWTSSSAHWDGRAITIEVANSVAGGSWPVSDAAFDKLARLIADVSIRYGFPINDDTILTHQELYRRYGASYATACPGDLQRRKGELLARANRYRAGSTPAGGGTTPVVGAIPASDMMRLFWDTGGTGWLYTENGMGGLPSMQVYNLFRRLINSNQRADRPETFLRAEVDIMNAQVRLIRAANRVDAQIDGAKLGSAIRDALAVGGIPVAVEDLRDELFELDPDFLAGALEAAVPRVSSALLRNVGGALALAGGM